jgi:2-iminobutanoate/2-iminopropanoate deaminase
MDKRVIQTGTAPAAIGPYSQAIATGQLVFTSGQIGLDPATGQLVPGGFEAEVRQAFRNLEAIALAAGGSFANLVKVTLFLTDLGQFGLVNSIMQELLKEPYPARSTVGIASLPRGALFEIEALLAL